MKKDFKIIGGFAIPVYDDHFSTLGMKIGSYQVARLIEAVSLLHPDRRRVALDIGAHIGIHTVWMAEHFEQVIAFEPHPHNFHCLEMNTADLENVTCHNFGLGNMKGDYHISSEETNTGNHQVLYNDSGLPIELKRIDDLGIHDCDFLKIDVQGFELKTLMGGEITIRRERPALMVEEEPPGKLKIRYDNGKLTVKKLLSGWGAELHGCMGADQLWAWK